MFEQIRDEERLLKIFKRFDRIETKLSEIEKAIKEKNKQLRDAERIKPNGIS